MRFSRSVYTGKPTRIACGLAFLLAVPLFPQAQPVWLQDYQRAVDELRSGNPAAASTEFETLWRTQQDFVLANAIGAALDSAGIHSKAAAWYKKSVELNPRYAPAYNNLGLNYAVQKQFRSAVRALETATGLDPHNGGSFYNLGLAQLELGDFRAAAQAFKRAHELAPLKPDPLSRLAYASFRSGRNSEALAAIDALALLPDDRQKTTLTSVQLLEGAGLYREALRRIRGAETAASSPALSFEEARVLFQLGEYQETASILQRLNPDPNAQPLSEGERVARTGRVRELQELPPDLALDYHLLLGSAQALAGNLPGAVKTLQDAVQIAPQRPEPYYRLALVFLDGYRDREAHEVLDAGLKALPSSPLLLRAAAIVDEVGGRDRQAIDDLQKSLELDAHQAEAWSELGDLYVKAGEYSEASEAYQSAMKQGATATTLVKYADLLVRLRRFAEAETLLRKAIERQNNLEQAYVVLGRLYNERQEYNRAETVLRHAIRLDAEDADAHLYLTNTLHHLGREREARVEAEFVARKKDAARARERRTVLRAVLVPDPVERGSEVWSERR